MPVAEGWKEFDGSCTKSAELCSSGALLGPGTFSHVLIIESAVWASPKADLRGLCSLQTPAQGEAVCDEPVALESMKPGAETVVSDQGAPQQRAVSWGKRSQTQNPGSGDLRVGTRGRTPATAPASIRPPRLDACTRSGLSLLEPGTPRPTHTMWKGPRQGLNCVQQVHGSPDH